MLSKETRLLWTSETSIVRQIQEGHHGPGTLVVHRSLGVHQTQEVRRRVGIQLSYVSSLYFVKTIRATYAVHLGVLHVHQNQEALQSLAGHRSLAVRQNQHRVLQHQAQARSDQLAGRVLQDVRRQVQQPKSQQSKVHQRTLQDVRQGRQAVVRRRTAR